jgi:hypothetical protein
MPAKNPRSNRAAAAKPRPEAAASGSSWLRFLHTPKGVFLVAAAVMMVAIAFLYRDLVFMGKVFFASDNQAAASFAAVGKKALAEGSYPVWNPYLFSGMPSFGSLSYTPYVYPVNFVVGFLRRVLFFPESTWLLFHTFLTGMGTFLLLADRGVNRAVAIVAGVLMMWMPNLVAVGANGHGSQACAVAYLPFALLFWDRIWRGKSLVANGAGLALVLGLSMLRGHLQVSYYTYLLVGLHMLFFGTARIIDGVRGRAVDAAPLPARFVHDGGSGPGRALAGSGFAAAVLALIVAVSLAMCAVLYLPVHDYAQYSIRGASEAGGLEYGYATSWSLHPSETLTFVAPFSFGFGKELYLGHMPFTDYPNYLGIVVTAFALVALFAARTRWVLFLAFVALLTTLVSFGKFFPPVYDLFFKFLPYFSKFRVPVMILIVQELAVVGLFAAGLDAVIRSDRAQLRRWALRGLLAAGLLFLVAIFSHGYWTDGFANAAAARVRATQNPDEQRMVARLAGGFIAADFVQIGLLALTLAAAVFAFASMRRMSVLTLCMLVLLLGAVDYLRVDRYILHPEAFRGHDAYRIIRDKPDTERYLQTDDMMTFLQRQEGPFRVFPMDSPQRPFSALFTSNRFMVFDISSVGGYHPAKLADYEQFLRAFANSLANGSFALVDMMNVRFIVSGARLPDHPQLRPAWTGRDFEGQARAIYENLGALPRAWVVGEYRVAGSAETMDAIALPEFDPRRLVYLDREPPMRPEPGDSATVRETHRAMDEVSFSAELGRPGILVVSEIFYPDWKVTVDGEPAETMLANGVLRALALPAGRHEVAFRYDRSLIEKSAGISIGAFVLTLFALVGSLITRRKGMRWKRSS